ENLVNTLVQDLRHALRMMANAPGFAAIAILTLALGIGGNATVFSWIRSILLDPIPAVRDSEQMVAVESIMPSGEYHTSSYPDYKDFRAQNHVFSDVIGFELSGVNMSLRNTEPAERVWGIIATENYFDVLGVRAAMGSTFHEQANQALNSDPYIVLSYGLWARRFGSDPNVVGKIVHLNGHPFTIIGVAPRAFFGTIVGIDAQYFVPMMMQPQVLPGESIEERNPTFVHIMGRLKPGVSIAHAQADLATIAGNLAKEYSTTSQNVGVFVAPVWKAHYGVQDFLRSVLGFLMVIASLVLLIACVNVANLLLARATVREREIAIRAAMGASRNRLIRQMLAESVVLAVGGGIGGILLALWGANLLSFFTPATKHLPIGLTLGVDKTVLAFTLILSIATGIIFGLVPAWRGSRTNLNESLKSAGRVTEGRAGSHRLRDALVIAEVVFATVLLVCAGLLLRSMRNAEAAGPGFNTNHVALAAFDLRTSGYSSEEATLYYDRLLEKIRTLPGVESASLERFVPLWFTGRSYSPVETEAYTPAPGEDMNIDLNMVGADYLHTLQIPLISGRDFTEQDRADSPKVVIVNQTLAKRFWPGQDATGHRLRVWGDWRTVVGVARDIKYHRMNEPPQSFLYVPSLQARGTDANIIVRSELPTAAVVNAVRASAISLDAKVQPLEADDLGGLLHVSMFANRTAASLASVLGGLGLLLAALGIYGVLSYSVSQRFREIGIRVALGAQKGHVLRLVVGKGLQLAILGAAAGAAVALLVTRAMRDLLFGVGAGDPLTFAIVALGVTFVAAIAAYLPARRAMRVDPMVALRYE
ncbi:MAG: ABC transporter permease, partial [Candidatus Acidiferrales bacterium]